MSPIPIPTLLTLTESQSFDSVYSSLREEYGFLELDFASAQELFRQHYWSVDAFFGDHLFTVVQQRLSAIPSHFEPNQVTFHCVYKGRAMICKLGMDAVFGRFYDSKFESNAVELPSVFHLEALEFLKSCSASRTPESEIIEDFYSRLARPSRSTDKIIKVRKKYLLQPNDNKLTFSKRSLRSESFLRSLAKNEKERGS